MEKFIVSGGNRLYGKTRLKGAKNSILPLLAGALLTREKVTIRDCPDISDVAYMCEIIKSLGADVVRAGDEITISGGAKNGDVPESLAHEIRSSVFLMGSLVATLGRARIAYPGGCDIGLRPVDIHIRALKELNIKIDEQSGYINCATDGIVGADVGLDKISVGATENIMMAAVLGKGTTIIRNAAKEPEITDLQNMLNKMGAKVRGAGTPVIKIEGVTELHGAEYTPIPDRIVAGTLMTAVGIAGGEIEIENVVPEHIAAITSKLVKSSCKVRAFCDRIGICRRRLWLSTRSRKVRESSSKTFSKPVSSTSPIYGVWARTSRCTATSRWSGESGNCTARKCMRPIFAGAARWCLRGSKRKASLR